MKRKIHIFFSALWSVLCTVALSACGTGITLVGQPDGPTLAIGISTNSPGVGLLHDGEYSGFDVDVAQYVAQQLGYAKKQIIFVPVTPATANEMLTSRKVDLVVSALSMNEQEREDTQYIGPYLMTQQDLLIRKSDAKTITGPASLQGKHVCTVSGSGAGENITKEASAAIIQERDSYLQCVTSLMVGESDAITADDAVISGLVTTKGKPYLMRVGQPIAQAPHAIRVYPDNVELGNKILTILRKMVQDGSWSKAADRMKTSIQYEPDLLHNPPDMSVHKN